MLDFSRLVKALDESVSDDTDAAIVITAQENTATGEQMVIVRAFGSNDAVIEALDAALSDLMSTHRPRDMRLH